MFRLFACKCALIHWPLASSNSASNPPFMLQYVINGWLIDVDSLIDPNFRPTIIPERHKHSTECSVWIIKEVDNSLTLLFAFQRLVFFDLRVLRRRRRYCLVLRVVFVGGKPGNFPSLDLIFPPTGLSKNFPARERMIPLHCWHSPELHQYQSTTHHCTSQGLKWIVFKFLSLPWARKIAFTSERDELSWLCYFTQLLTHWVSIFFDCFVHT